MGSFDHNVQIIVLSHFDYCSTIYNGLSKKITFNISRYIRSSIRIIYQQRSDHSSITERMIHLNIMDINMRLGYRLLKIVHKVIEFKLPCYLKKNISFRIAILSWNLRRIKGYYWRGHWKTKAVVEEFSQTWLQYFGKDSLMNFEIYQPYTF